MFRIMEEEKPEYLTVAFDLSAPTFGISVTKLIKEPENPCRRNFGNRFR